MAAPAQVAHDAQCAGGDCKCHLSADDDWDFPAPGTGPKWEWLEDIDNTPLWMTDLPSDISSNEALAALQTLKLPDSPDEAAEYWKEHGNFEFKKGKAGLQEALRCYTQAVECNASDPLKRATYLINRAAANLALENYGRTASDCKKALELNPSSTKAAYRGAKACNALEKWEEAQWFAKAGIKADPTSKELKTELRVAEIALQKQRIRERDAARRKEEEQREKAMWAEKYESRNIVLGSTIYESQKQYSEEGCKVQELGEELVWPALFLYEEYMQSDAVQAFRETDTLFDHLDVMFGEGVPPAHWDVDRKYKACDLEVHVLMSSDPLKHKTKQRVWPSGVPKLKGATIREIPGHSHFAWVQFPLETQLATILAHPNYEVPGFPVFHVVVKGSAFRDEFLARCQLAG
eukprot:tig00021352_g20733.t1